MNRSFIMSNLSKSLFWYEQPEQFAHSHSFVLSDMSKSLTVAHLIWAIWVNEQMSRAGNSLIWFPSESLVFVQKWANEQFSQKNEWFTHSLMFGEQNEWFAILLISSEGPEQITHGRSFLVSEMSNSLTSLIWFEQNEQFTHKKEEMSKNEWFAHFYFFNFFKNLK